MIPANQFVDIRFCVAVDCHQHTGLSPTCGLDSHLNAAIRAIHFHPVAVLDAETSRVSTMDFHGGIGPQAP